MTHLPPPLPQALPQRLGERSQPQHPAGVPPLDLPGAAEGLRLLRLRHSQGAQARRHPGHPP